MANDEKKTKSWGCIAILMIVFWPLGLYYLYKAMTADKTALVKNSKVTKTIAYILFVVGGINVLTSANNKPDIFGPSLLIVIFACWLYRRAVKSRAKGEKYEKYKTIVYYHAHSSIAYVATAMNVSEEEANTDLQDMIKRGYFPGAYINEFSKKIVLTQHSNQNITDNNDVNTGNVMNYNEQKASNKQNTSNDKQSQNSLSREKPLNGKRHAASELNLDEQQNLKRTESNSGGGVSLKRNQILQCPNCGAVNNIAAGAEAKCEYCGSALK